MYSYIYFEEDS